MNLSQQLAYCIDEYEPHFMSFCAAIQTIAGGTLFTCSAALAQEYTALYGCAVIVTKNRQELANELLKRKIKAVIFPGFHSVHYQPLRSHMRFYQIHHGMSDKSEFHNNAKWATCDVNFVAGQRLKNSIDKYKATNVVVGYVKTDKLVNGQVNIKDLQQTYNVCNYDKTILYAPTWDDAGTKTFLSSMTKIDPNELMSAIPENWQLIIRPHPCLYRFSQPTIAAFEMAAKARTNVVFQHPPTKYDVIDLSTVCDLLITDVSAVAYEFLASNKPLVFIDHSHVKPDNRHIYKAGHVQSTANLGDIGATLHRAFLENKAPERAQIISETLHAVDGKVVSRILDYIKQDLHI